MRFNLRLTLGDQLHHLHQPLFCKGDPIEVTSGPLSGFQWVFSKEKAIDRALILISVLGRVNLVEIGADSLSSPG